MNEVFLLKNDFIKLGAKRVISYSEVPDSYTYIVINGNNLLALGKGGTKQRIRSFFPGNTGSSVHTKTFVVAAAHALWGPNEIYLIKFPDSKNAKDLEDKLSKQISSKLIIEDAQNLKDLFEKSEYLWQELLKENNLAVAEEVSEIMKLVFDNGDVLKSVLRRLKSSSNTINKILGEFFKLKQGN